MLINILNNSLHLWNKKQKVVFGKSDDFKTPTVLLRIGQRQLTVTSSRRPLTCVGDRKCTDQLIVLAVVDAWSCCCLDTVLLRSAPVDVEATPERRKGRDGHFTDWAIRETVLDVSQWGLCISAAPEEELAAEQQPGHSDRLDGSSLFTSLNTHTLEFASFFSAHRLFIFILCQREGERAASLSANARETVLLLLLLLTLS